MSAEAARWVRAQVWTASMRKTHRELPLFYSSCPCMAPPVPTCAETGQAWCETYVTNRRTEVVNFAAPYVHPTWSATGAHQQREPMVWLADRRCRRLCVCEVRPIAATGAAAEPVSGPQDRPRPAVLVSASDGAEPAAPAATDAAGSPSEPAVWQEVMGRAARRCQCAGCRHHSGRCVTEHGRVTKLLAAPIEPGPDPLRQGGVMDPARLQAWCGRCWSAAVRGAARASRQAVKAAWEEASATLF